MPDENNTEQDRVSTGGRLERLISFFRAAKKERKLILLLLAFIGFIVSLIWLAVAGGGEVADALDVRLADMTVGHVVGLIFFAWLLFK